MSVDPYAPCPCGSGKKVKFCCQAILPDMEKVERLLENNQPRMAIAALEKVLPTHGGNAWVATAQGWALIADRRPADAKAALAQFLRKNPDHPSANALHALAAFQTDGFPTAKKAVHRAFRRSFKAEPSIVCGLAASMAEVLLSQGRVLASRQHFALALRYGDEEDRKAAFSAMVDIDGDAAIPYPLRGVHNVPEFAGPPDVQESVQKAHRLSAVGCWEEAAEIFQQIAEQHPDSAETWQTLGLFHAWDGNDQAASEALHRAARLIPAFETAVECETLAQLLEHPPEKSTNDTSAHYTADSVSRLLSTLDEQPRFSRLPAGALQMAGLNDVIAAQYDILDQPVPADDALADMTLETAPQSLGRLVVLVAAEDESGQQVNQVLLNVLPRVQLPDVQALVESAAGDSLKRSEIPLPRDMNEGYWDTEERAALRESYFLHYNTPVAARERIEREWQTKLINELWPTVPQKALGGKTPREAKGVDELKVQLAAAINTLDAFCDTRSRMLPVNELRKEYGLPELEPIDVPADANVNLLSLMQLRRVNLKSLSDDQFRPLLRRVLLSRHNLHAYEVLREYLENRSQLHAAEPRERDEVLSALVDICRRNLRRDEAIRLTQEGQSLARSSEKPFELLLGWKMKEMNLRLEDRTDPQGKALFDEIWTQFGAKIPAIRESLMQLAQYMGFELPGQGVVVAEGGIGGISLEPAGAATGEKKLWLPGMD